MSDKNEKDLSLFQQIKQGDQRAFQRLFNQYYESLLMVAIRFLKDVNTAKDIVQDVFLTLWNKRESIMISSYVYAYLKRATVNKSLNYLKSQKHFEEETALATVQQRTASAQDELEASDLEKVIKTAIDSLPERCRAVFLLKRYEEKSLKEISTLLDISPKTAEHQMTKALKVLKNAVLTFQTRNQ